MADRKGGVDRLKKAWAALIGDERESEREGWPRANNDNWNGVVGALQGIRHDNQVSAAEQQAEWNRAAERDRRRFWLEVAAIGVAAIGATFLWRQQIIMKGQLDEMKDQRQITMAQLRAYVLPTEALVNNISGIPPAVVVIKNTGLTPAFHVTTIVRFAFDKYPPQKPLARIGTEPSDKLWEYELGPGQVVTSQQNIPRNVQLNIPSQEALKNRSWAFYIYGRTHYIDAFGKSITERFSFIVGGIKDVGDGKAAVYQAPIASD